MTEVATKGTPAGDGAIRPFQIDVPQEAVEDRRRRIAATRWPERETVDDGSQGVPLELMLPTTTASFTVVVHGAFADSSSWAGVIERLQANEAQVTAAADPLRGISHDSAYVAGLFDQIPGPVLAVGHSYGSAAQQSLARSL